MKTLRIAALIAAATAMAGCSPRERYIKNEGFVFGTTYNIVYKHTADLSADILKRLKAYDQSLSTFNDSSIISRINRNESAVADTFFVTVFNKAKEFNQLSGGRFDITIAPLSRLWKFGNHRPDTITTSQYDSIVTKIDSVKAFVGMDKVWLEGNTVCKADPRVRLDACALAEGYGIDIAAQVLEEHGITDYMVEIGGEIHAKGLNPHGKAWRIGIDRPVEGSTAANRTMQHIISLTNCAISTSGSYRQFYYTDKGERLSHTIDPRSGHPVKHSMLSVSVVGPNTMTTDAIATTLMVAGPDEALAIADSLPGIEAHIIYLDADGIEKEQMTDGFSKLIEK